MRLALVAGVLAAAVAAAHAGAAAAPTGTALRVTYWSEGRPGPSQTWTLACRPARGSHPAPGRACLRLAALTEPFRPVPREAMCTLQYGGPQEALVTGHHGGRSIWTRFNLRDGCHITRWQRHVPLLPARSATAG